MTTKLAFTVS